MPVLFGIFLYMGIASLRGVQVGLQFVCLFECSIYYGTKT